MFANRYTVFLDACVLVGVLKRNLLLTLADAGFFRPAWSNEVLFEAERAITRLLAQRGVERPEAIAAQQIARMHDAFPEACVASYGLLKNIVLPDPDDAHVLAAAIKAKAETLVTDNIVDFPRNVLDAFDIEIRSADNFIADMISLDLPRGLAAVHRMRQRFQNPILTGPVLLDKMKAARLTRTISVLREHIESV